MRLTRLFVVGLAALWTHPADADTRDDVTALIHAGDQPVLLTALADPDPAAHHRPPRPDPGRI